MIKRENVCASENVVYNTLYTFYAIICLMWII